MNLFYFAVVLFVYSHIGFVLATISPKFVLNTTNYNQLHKKSLARLSKRFTAYYLSYPPTKTYDTVQCHKDDYKNATHMIFTSLIQRCPNPNYTPRVLSRSQITWKNRNDDAKPSNKTTETPKPKEESSDDKHDTIHKFLLFVMLLPNHPFSQNLHRLISSVAPMFPEITVVVGNAHEFRDMCNKYFVQSYPKILFFKQGLYEDSYEDKLELHFLVGQITKWTRLLPKSLPYLRSNTEVKMNSTFGWDSLNIEYFMVQPFQWMERLNFTQWSNTTYTLGLPVANLEPFIGSVKRFRLWDHIVYVFSGLYTLLRCFQWLSSRVVHEVEH